MKKTLATLLTGALALSGIAQGIRLQKQPWREDFNLPVVARTAVKTPVSGWNIQDGKLQIEDDTNNSRRNTYFITDDKYSSKDNYAVMAEINRSKWNYSTDKIGVIVNGKAHDDFYSVDIHAIDDSSKPRFWGFRYQAPTYNYTIANGQTDAVFNDRPNKITVKVSDLETHIYINDTFIAGLPPIPQEYEGSVGFVSYDSSNSNDVNNAKAQNRYEFLQVVTEELPLSFALLQPTLGDNVIDLKINTLENLPYRVEKNPGLTLQNWINVQEFTGQVGTNVTHLTVPNPTYYWVTNTGPDGKEQTYKEYYQSTNWFFRARKLFTEDDY